MCDVLLQDDVYDLYRLLESCVVQRRKFFEKPHIAPLALYRLICAFGHQSLVPVLTRCGLPLPVYFLADEKHSRCLTDKVYLPTIVCGRVLWHLGYTEAASTAAFTQS
jgi:hypothetical protein